MRSTVVRFSSGNAWWRLRASRASLVNPGKGTACTACGPCPRPLRASKHAMPPWCFGTTLRPHNHRAEHVALSYMLCRPSGVSAAKASAVLEGINCSGGRTAAACAGRHTAAATGHGRAAYRHTGRWYYYRQVNALPFIHTLRHTQLPLHQPAALGACAKPQSSVPVARQNTCAPGKAGYRHATVHPHLLVLAGNALDKAVQALLDSVPGVAGVGVRGARGGGEGEKGRRLRKRTCKAWTRAGGERSSIMKCMHACMRLRRVRRAWHHGARVREATLSFRRWQLQLAVCIMRLLAAMRAFKQANAPLCHPTSRLPRKLHHLLLRAQQLSHRDGAPPPKKSTHESPSPPKTHSHHHRTSRRGP